MAFVVSVAMASSISCDTRFFSTGFLRLISCNAEFAGSSSRHSDSCDARKLGCWNGHYACTCYHPLFMFNRFGDLERCALRPGNVHSADEWDAVLKPVVAAISRQGFGHLFPG